MDKWVIRTPRPPPEPKPAPLPAANPEPPSSRPSSKPPSSRNTPSRHTPSQHSQHASSRHTPSQSPTSQPSSSPPPPKRRVKHTIEVRIPRLVHEPQKLQPLRLIPDNDSTAYIKDTMLLPPAGLAADGNPLPMRMGYLVGWTDLPSASMVVPAADLLEYVSPYAYEQFEYARWKERKRWEKEEEERLRIAAEAEKAAREAGQKVKLLTKVGRPGKKKRGRPRRSVHMPVDEEAIEKEARKRAGSQVREGQPSLSTPKKGILRGLVGEDEAEADAAIYRQLFGGETEIDLETSYPVTSEREGSGEYESEPPRKKLRSSSPVKQGYGGEELASSGMSPTPRAPVPTHSTSRPTLKYEEASPMPTGFTPVIPFKRARQTRGNPTSFESREASVSSRPSAKPSTTSKTPKKTPRKTPRKAKTPTYWNGASAPSKPTEEPAEPDEPQYEVKRLEGAKQLMIDGQRERYFLVRWKGNWAPEENPTWEPEEFLPASLVRKYLAKHPLVVPVREEKVESDVWPSRRYSSVTEAFEDPGDEGVVNGVEEHEEEEDDMEETFQVTEGAAVERTKPSSELFGKTLGFAFGKGFGTGGPS